MANFSANTFKIIKLETRLKKHFYFKILLMISSQWWSCCIKRAKDLYRRQSVLFSPIKHQSRRHSFLSLLLSTTFFFFHSFFHSVKNCNLFLSWQIDDIVSFLCLGLRLKNSKINIILNCQKMIFVQYLDDLFQRAITRYTEWFKTYIQSNSKIGAIFRM